MHLANLLVKACAVAPLIGLLLNANPAALNAAVPPASLLSPPALVSETPYSLPTGCALETISQHEAEIKALKEQNEALVAVINDMNTAAAAASVPQADMLHCLRLVLF